MSFFLLDDSPFLCLHFSPILSFSVYLRWRDIQCNVWRMLPDSLVHIFPSHSLLVSPFCSSLPPCLSAFSSLGHLSILFVFWASFRPPKYFRYYAGDTKAVVLIVQKLPVAPTHRQDYIKPWSKIHNLKGQAIKYRLLQALVKITGNVAKSTVHTVSIMPYA